MDRKAELAKQEEEAFDGLHAIVEGLTHTDLEEIYSQEDGWTVKDLLWHIGCWSAEACRQLERVRAGTYEDQNWDTDRLNQEFLEASRRMVVETVKAEWVSSRNRLLQEWDALPEVTPDAEEWFFESTAEHYEDHVPALRAWLNSRG
jgi:hypothetical protein